MLKFLEITSSLSFVCNDYFIALIGLSIRSQTQSPPEQYVGDSVSFGQRVISYPIQFVTGSIGNLFEKEAQKG